MDFFGKLADTNILSSSLVTIIQALPSFEIKQIVLNYILLDARSKSTVLHYN